MILGIIVLGTFYYIYKENPILMDTGLIPYKGTFGFSANIYLTAIEVSFYKSSLRYLINHSVRKPEGY